MTTAPADPYAGTTTLLVTIEVAPADVDEFLAGLRISYGGCAGEPELLYFQVYRDQDIPGRLQFLELWDKNRVWFETVQLNKSYYAPYLEKTQHLWTKDRILTYLDVVPGWRTVTPTYLQRLQAPEN